MPRFAANLSFLFDEVVFLERFEAAAQAGFEGVEYLFPYAWPAEEIAERLARHRLTQALFNLPPGNWDAGDRGLVGAGVRRLAVAGGETSGAVVNGLKIPGLRIGAQIDPGVPWTLSLGKPPVHLALKSGNFGSRDFFDKAFKVLP